MMKKYFLLSLICLLAFPSAVWAQKLKVVGTYPYIEDLTRQIGGEAVQVSSLAKGNWDPHFIVPKPSLLIQLRQADLLIINGAQLEIGWLPPLLRQANHARIQPGQAGFLELSQFVQMIQKPENTSRALGDVHPQGNPHFILDPNNVLKTTDAITKKLCQLAQPQCQNFQARNTKFKTQWLTSTKIWQQKMAPLKGKKVLEYHRLHDYFLHHYGLQILNTLEALPGIPPSPQHLAQIIKQTKQDKAILNLRGVYNPEGPSNLVSKQSAIPLVTLPHDVNSLPGTANIFQLFESLIQKITQTGK